MQEHVKSMITGAFFTLVAVGFAYAVPNAIRATPVVTEVEAVACPEDAASDETSEGDDIAVETESEGDVGGDVEGDLEGDVEGEVTEGDDEECVPAETETKKEEASDAEEEEDSGDAPENHGQVVRVVAHCDVKGPEKGRAVSSIATDPDATKAEAEKACEEAKAAAAKSTREGKVKKEQRSKGRPEGAGRPAHAGGASSPGTSGGGTGKGARG